MEAETGEVKMGEHRAMAEEDEKYKYNTESFIYPLD